MNPHANSLAAYRAGKLDVFPQRSQMILRALQQLARGTDREILDRLGMADMNAVRPRITELIKLGVLEETGDRIDPLTGKRVRVVRIVPAPSREPQQLELHVA